MPLQILNEITPGERFSQALGTGLQGLAQGKLQNLQMQDQARALQMLSNPQLSPEQKAQYVPFLPPQMQQDYLKQEMRRPSEEAYAKMLGLGGSQSGMSKDMGLEAEEMGLQNQGTPRLTEKQATELVKLQKQQEKADRQAEEKLLKRMDEKEAKGWEYNKAYLESADKDFRSAENNLQDLNRFKELEKEGLISPEKYSFLKAAGLDIPALMDPASEEFVKIRNSWLRDAKKYFGARVTNFELDQFLKTIPDLMQSPEGRKRVIANLERLNKIDMYRQKAIDKVINENNGIPPYNLSMKVNQRMEKYYNKAYEQFKKDLEKDVPGKPSSFLGTALAKGAGSIAREIGEAIPPAVLGGASGALIGGATGGIPGALIGGLRGAGVGAGAKLTGGALRSLFGGG
jgi:hypothetical protein